MTDYIFILGRDYELSMLELIAYMEKNQLKFYIKSFSEQAAVISVDEAFDPKSAMASFGGVVKIGVMTKTLENVYEGTENKISYAISFYGKNNKVFIEEQAKKAFKKQKLKAFYKKPKRENALMPTEVLNKSLLDEGVEILSYNNLLAKTVAVFDPLEHERRDEEMPCKDYLKTISIRLAKILINLSQAKRLLLDPFCGNGVILQEALLQGINVIGVDIDAKSAESANKNLEYVENKYGTKAEYTVLQGDSKQLTKFVTGPDGMATEPYLGPYLKSLPSFEEANKTMRELEGLYFKTLAEAKQVVGGKIAMIVPRFQTRQRKDVVMNFDKMIKKLEFKAWQPMKQLPMPVMYSHGRVLREIWVLENALINPFDS
ncbi:hypothetical protein FJZ53_03865 [Candidatus Woesearchaeota archaeon]|nr:hypothetical protein [Candidatus Woesearchaeota archaeon]